MADLDAALMQQIFDIPERKRKADVQDHCQTDDFGAGFEVLEERAFFGARTLRGGCTALKPSSSDRTQKTLARTGWRLSRSCNDLGGIGDALRVQDSSQFVARGRAAFRSVAVFSELDDEALAAVVDLARIRTWSADQTIFCRGDEGSYLLLVLEGRVRLSIVSSGGRELLVRVATPGELVGEIACFDGCPRSADAMATEMVRALVLSRADYCDIAARFPRVNEAVIRYLGALLRDTNDRLEALALHNLHARLARFLLFALRQLNGEDDSPVQHLALSLTQGELSQMLGASRPKINRLLGELRETGVIVQEGAAWRCDVTALQALAEDDG